MDSTVSHNDKSLCPSQCSETFLQAESRPDENVQGAGLQICPTLNYTSIAPGGPDYTPVIELGESSCPTMTLTPQVLHRHDLEQHNLHRNPSHLRNTQGHHAHRLYIAATELGIGRLMQDLITQESVGMTPYERFEDSSDCQLVAGSDQQHVVPANETPSASRQSQSHASSVTIQCSPNGRESIIANYNPNSVLWYRSSQAAPREGDPTAWGYDLAGVGTQFDDVVQSPDTVTQSLAGDGV